MKNVIFSLPILLSISLSMFSCKHNKDLPSPTNISCRLDSIVYRYPDFSYTEQYAYYPNGKLKSQATNPAQSSEYRYEGDLVIESITTQRYPATDKITYVLGVNGLASKSYDFFVDEESNVSYDTTHYTYNTAGYLVRKVLKRAVHNYEHTLVASFETVTTYEVVNGNTTVERTVTTGSAGEFQGEEMTASYEFYTEKVRKEEGSKPVWLGKGNANLVKKAFKNEPGTVSTTTEYTYELDAKGYVSKATANGVPLTYHYTCL